MSDREIVDASNSPPKKFLWRFRLLAFLIGLSPLLVAEVALRFAGIPNETWDDPAIDVSSQPDLFVRRGDNQGSDTDRYEIDPARSNYFQPASFSATKSADTRRVFVLGGSTVQGRPYATETAFANWLRIGLSSADPSHRYEVVNCGGVSYASYRVDKILQEVLRHQPDAIVIYTGHNEFLEDRTYAAQRFGSGFSKLVDHVGQRLQTVAALRHALTRPAGDAAEPRHLLPREVAARLDAAGGLEAYTRDESWRGGVIADFRRMLASMLRRCQDANVRIILCVPAADCINTPPFKTVFDHRLAPQQLSQCESLWETVRDGDQADQARLSAAQGLLAIDPAHAGAHYFVGRRLLDAGQRVAAAQHLIAAKDHDVCPLRAPTQIVQAVRQITDQFDFDLVDVPTLFDQNADALEDAKWFVDHIHPSIEGHQRIAAALAEQFDRFGWITWDEAAKESSRRAASQYLGTLGEEYFQRGRQRLRGLQQWAAGRAGQTIDDSEMTDKR